MRDLLKDDERNEVDRINSKIHGPEYLATDLKNILRELKFLLKINDAIILVDDRIRKKEFLGKGEDFYIKYFRILNEYIVKSRINESSLIAQNVNHKIKNLFVLPIKKKDKVIGVLVIFNNKFILNKNPRNSRIIKILEQQINSAVSKASERESLFSIFGKYLDQRQIFEILKDPDFLKTPKIIDSVVLFADISGFTKFTNKSDTEFIFDFLSKVLNKSSEIINRNNGVVDKFVGDQIIGIFGITDNKNRSENALKSALEIREFFKEFKKYKIDIKISIVKGSMIYGNLGGNYKTDLTVIGKNVNFASRLCDYAKSGEILVGDKVYEKLKDNYKFKTKAFKKFKGFSEWSRVYRFVS
jgi:class 3 adenylate cyclase